MIDGRMDVVVTRPEPDHAVLLAAVEGRGYRPIHCPAFRLDAVDPERIRRDFHAGPGFDFLIVTSPMAARLLLEAVTAAGLAGTVLLAPGKGTAGILEAAGLQVDIPESGSTSEDLLCLPVLEAVEGLSIAIVGAPGGRELLGQQLDERGARITRLNVYHRERQAPAAALLDLLDPNAPAANGLVVLISSSNAFEMLTEAVGPERRVRWFEADFIVSSPRLGSICRRVGVTRVWLADGPRDAQMIGALDRLMQTGAIRGSIPDAPGPKRRGSP